MYMCEKIPRTDKFDSSVELLKNRQVSSTTAAVCDDEDNLDKTRTCMYPKLPVNHRSSSENESIVVTYKSNSFI